MSDDRLSSPERPRARLIVNADDFGRTYAINAAVAEAFDRGILTSASLMVTAAAADDAVRVARDRRGLAVGLHLVVLGARSALSPEVIPHLVDSQGSFSRKPFAAGLRYFFSRTAQTELEREIEAQFEAFGRTGLPLSHVDGHHHMHLHPTVFRLLLPLAREFGAQAVRVPIADDLLLSLRVDRRHPVLKLGWKIVFSPLAAWCRRTLKSCALPTADRVYGLMQTGHVTEGYLVRLLDSIAGQGAGRSMNPPPLVEVFCHPSLRRHGNRLGPNPGDLEALVSPAVRETVASRGVVLTTYRASARHARPDRPPGSGLSPSASGPRRLPRTPRD